MKVVVTGAAGHIGGNLTRALIARGERPRVLVRSDRRALDGLDVEVVDGDVRDRASLERAFDGAERVFHLAAHISISPGEEELVEAINVRGVKNVVEACLARGVKRLIHFSSIHALASEPTGTPVDESRPLAADSPLTYDRSKAGGEREVRAGIERGLDAVVVNPTGVIGPHDYRPSRMGEVFLSLYRRT
ncbi:MAG TPA: NAD-dependent epimerase/dehydratase family protein, partial [Polyangia bacterium]